MNDQHKSKAILIAELADARASISELESTAQALQVIKRQNQILLEAIPDMIFTLDKDGTYLDFIPSKEFESYVSPEEFIGRKVPEIMTPELASTTMENIEKALTTGKTQVFEYQLPGSGELQTWESRIGPLDKDTVIAVARDITERKRTEDALRESEEHFRVVLKNAPITVFNQDRDLRFTWVYNPDPHFEPELLLGMTDADIAAPEEAAKVMAIKRRVIETGEGTRQEISFHANGSTLFYDLTVEPLHDANGDIVGITCVSVDITERKQAELALLLERNKLKSIFKAMDDGVYIVDQNFDIEYVNPALMTEFGPYEGRKCYGYFHDSEEVCSWCKNQDVFAGRTVHWEWHSKKNGKTYDLIDTPLRNVNGIISKLEIFRDITERKQVEEALRESEAINRALLNAIPDMIFHVRRDGKYLRFIPGTNNEPLIPPEEFIGKKMTDILPAENAQAQIEAIAKALKTGEVQVREDIFLVSRERHYFESRFSAVGKDETVVITREITKRKNKEKEREALVASLEQKNAEMERFNYTVSHDLKSPLITIKGFTSLLEQDLAKENTQCDVQVAMGHINRAVDKMHLLLDDLLDLSRVGRLKNPPEKFALGSLVSEVIEQLSGPIENGKVHVTIDPDLLAVFADRTGMSQVLQNLIENGIKFMGAQTKPTIKIGSRVEEEDTVIYVQDNGIGIDPQYHDRIFQLFRQLEPSRDGTGVGLTLVKRIVELHGGRIWVESEGQGKGCSFCFVLPES